jgi:hypothetical protein
MAAFAVVAAGFLVWQIELDAKVGNGSTESYGNQSNHVGCFRPTETLVANVSCFPSISLSSEQVILSRAMNQARNVLSLLLACLQS